MLSRHESAYIEDFKKKDSSETVDSSIETQKFEQKKMTQKKLFDTELGKMIFCKVWFDYLVEILK